MPILDIVKIPDPILRQVSKPVETFDERLNIFIDKMFETMYEAPGIGLAAIQTAHPIRVLVMDCGDPKDEIERAAQLDEWETAVQIAEEKGEEPPARPERKPSTKRPMALINPEIISVSDEVSVYDEGCLSIPDYYAEVERPSSCVIKYIDRNAKDQILEASGLLSTCVQHELDHLNGTLFIDHISKLKREMVIKKFTKIARQTGMKPASKLVI